MCRASPPQGEVPRAGETLTPRQRNARMAQDGACVHPHHTGPHHTRTPTHPTSTLPLDMHRTTHSCPKGTPASPKGEKARCFHFCGRHSLDILRKPFSTVTPRGGGAGTPGLSGSAAGPGQPQAAREAGQGPDAAERPRHCSLDPGSPCAGVQVAEKRDT